MRIIFLESRNPSKSLGNHLVILENIRNTWACFITSNQKGYLTFLSQKYLQTLNIRSKNHHDQLNFFGDIADKKTV